MENSRATTLGKFRCELVLLGDKTSGQQLPALAIDPAGGKGHPQENEAKRVVLWLTDTGKSGLLTSSGDPHDGVTRLLDAGCTVVGVDLLYQGEFLPDGGKLAKTRLNQLYPDKADDHREPWEHFSGYTFGYNPPLFSQRCRT